MIQIALDGDMLTWAERPVPTEPGVQHLPEYGGFTITTKGRAALHQRRTAPAPIDPDDPDESDWPLDPPFADD